MLDLIACPECGYASVIVDRSDIDSTDGPVEHVRIRCVNRHRFTMPTDRLETVEARPDRPHPLEPSTGR